MKSRGRLTRVLATVVVLGWTVGEAAADRTREVKGRQAGTFLHTRMDIFPLDPDGMPQPDGVPASWSTGAVVDDFGESTVQGVNESVPTGETPDCPGGVFVIDAQNGMGFGTGVQTFPNGADQLYAQTLTSTLCADEAGGFTAVDTGIIVGGAGRFEGVSGTWESRYSGITQFFDPGAVPPQAFGSYTAKFKATLTFPD